MTIQYLIERRAQSAQARRQHEIDAAAAAGAVESLDGLIAEMEREAAEARKQPENPELN